MDYKFSTIEYSLEFETYLIEQVAWIKSNLLLKIQKQKTQTLQIFTEVIKQKSIYKSNLIVWLEGLVDKNEWSN